MSIGPNESKVEIGNSIKNWRSWFKIKHILIIFSITLFVVSAVFVSYSIKTNQSSGQEAFYINDSNNYNTKYDKKARAEMQEYLQTKYGRNFTLWSYRPKGNGYNRETWDQAYAFVGPAENEKESKSFIVRRFTEGKITKNFDDGYPFILASEAIKQEVRNIAEPILGPVNLNISLAGYTSATTFDPKGDIDIDAFLTVNGGITGAINIFANPSSLSDTAQQVDAVSSIADSIAKTRLAKLGSVLVAVFLIDDTSKAIVGQGSTLIEIAEKNNASMYVWTEIVDGKQRYDKEKIKSLMGDLTKSR